MPEKDFIQHVLHLSVFFYIDSRRCDFRNDNLGGVLEEHIEGINNKLSNVIELSLDEKNTHCHIKILDMERFLDLWDDTVHLLSLVSRHNIHDPIEYVHMHFSWFLKYTLLVFFLVVQEKIPKWYFLQRYILSKEDSLLKDILLFYYYAFFWDGGKDIKISLSYLETFIEKYPECVSFRLFKVRQRFELFYRTIIGKKKFNYLVSTSPWRKYLQNHSYIISCFQEFDICRSINSDHSVINLFEGKLYLHLMNEVGVEILLEYLNQEEIVYDTDIYSWIGVYYLQSGDYQKALWYIKIAKYPEDDVYKYYTKLIFLYVIAWWKEKFLDLIWKEIPQTKILFYNDGNYFIFQWDEFKQIQRPKDINDITRYMSFGVNNFEKVFTTIYSEPTAIYQELFQCISHNYYDHWHFESTPKIFFKLY